MRLRALAFTSLVALFGCSAAKVEPPGSTSGTSGASRPTTASSSSGATASSATAGTSGSTSSSASSGSGSGSSGSASSGTGAGTTGASIDALVGVNGFIDDPKANLTTFGTVREYHNWSWNDGNGMPGYPDGGLQFSLWNGFWDFDDYYSSLAAAGVTVFPAVQGSIDALGNAMPPVKSGADPEAAASYAAHASFMFQMAARYGSVAVPDSELRLADGQVRTSGMDVLHYLENGNEPDNNWTRPGGAYLITPAQFAAQSSADYDGDQGRMGEGFGVKTADPNMKMVLAGLAMAGDADGPTNAESYLDGIRAWAAAHRGGDFPADVINVHSYCMQDGFGVSNPRPARSPEDCGLGQTIAALVAYRNANLPGKELWLTEFGYDTDPGSNNRAPAIGSMSAEEVQGAWLVRSILAVAEAGVDRATVFVSRDGCTGSGCSNAHVQYTTSGVTTDGATGYVPKASWYYLAAFRSALAGTHYAGTRASGRADVRIDAFADASGRGGYVVWLPSSTDAKVSGYALPVADASSATEVTLVDQSATGSSRSLAIQSGKVSVDVSEIPLIVQVDRLR